MQNNIILKNLLALNLVSGFGPKRVKQLLEKFPDTTKVFKLSKSQIRSIEGIGEASALSLLSFNEWEQVESILDATKKTGSKILTIYDKKYPNLLKQIYDPPILIWYKGDIELLNEPGIAVVGTRNTSTYGKKIAKELTTELCKSGLCIFSGLAHGIDSVAHYAALETEGRTVAVLGSGIDWIYPSRNKGLANAIVKSEGLVITEYPPGTKPDAGNFPVRNRIVSGLSLGTVVIESGIQGGSMITAELALDQNREVFAVPHPINSASGTGCNYLIKNGAKLVQTVDDIIEELPLEENIQHSLPNDTLIKTLSWRELKLDELSKKICEQLEDSEYQIDALSDKLDISTSQLLVSMLSLEMKQIVTQKAGKIFQLR